MTQSLETLHRMPSHCLPLYQIPYHSSCNFFRKPKNWTNTTVQMIEAELTISDRLTRKLRPSRSSQFVDHVYQHRSLPLLWFSSAEIRNLIWEEIFYRSSLFSSSKCAERASRRRYWLSCCIYQAWDHTFLIMLGMPLIWKLHCFSKSFYVFSLKNYKILCFQPSLCAREPARSSAMTVGLRQAGGASLRRCRGLDCPNCLSF